MLWSNLGIIVIRKTMFFDLLLYVEFLLKANRTRPSVLEHMKQAISLTEVVADTLHQMMDFLDQIEEERYKEPLDIFSTSTIGQHTRHVIEFFQCLMEQAPQGTVNYEKRRRNVMIEENPSYASQAIETIVECLRSNQLDREFQLESSYGEENAVSFVVPTTLERELIYNIEHAIHHLAMIRMGLKVVAPEVSLPHGFGIAPSTLKYRNRVRQ